MKIESLLPLGKLDPGLREPDTPLDIRDFARLSKVAEDVGLDAVLVEETKDDPFQMMALRATTTERIQLGTSVAMAFPRSPTAIAMSAWSLAKLSEGRFILGHGTQVRAHIQRHFDRIGTLLHLGCVTTSVRRGRSGGAGRIARYSSSRASTTHST